MVSVKYCDSCGHSSPLASNFCERCGHKLASSTAPAPSLVAAAPGRVSTRPGNRRVSISMFAAIILCFFLPFVLVSCDSGQPLGELSGIQMVTGFETQGEPYHPVPAAVMAFVAAVAGLGTAIFLKKGQALIAAAAGYIGAGSIFIIKLGTDYEASRTPIKADYLTGFWITLMLFVGAAIYHTRLLLQKKP